MSLAGIAFDTDATHAWRILDRVYAAAAAEAGWGETLDDIRRAGGFDAAALVALDRRCGTQGVVAAVGLDGGTVRPVNPLLSDAVLRSRPGAVWFDREIMIPALWDQTPFRCAWMAPHGFVTWGCVVIASDPERLVYLEVYAGLVRTPLGAEATMLLNRLAPHLIRACRMGGIACPTPPRERTRGIEAALPAHLVQAPLNTYLRGTLGLTRAEARLALHLASGGSLARASLAFRVQISTLRSQLGAIYVKTDTNRQNELVALLLREPAVAEAARIAEVPACA